MNLDYNQSYPGIDDLRNRAKSKIPRFAFEYLDGGCNEDVNLYRNTAELRNIQLKPIYLNEYTGVDMSTTLFGKTYSAPFGVAPVGLQGLIWPNSPNILAKAAHKHNVPFILSTVTTSAIEDIAKITEGNFWYQLYHPAEEKLRDDIIRRLKEVECDVLVILSDVPTFGFRPRDIRNGLAMPPRMTLNNIVQIMGRPHWALQTLIHGTPSFATMKPYMPKGLDMKQLGAFMDRTFSGRLNRERIAAIRDQWKGKLVIKGIASAEDAQLAIDLGLDGIIVSNHGGRQLDAAESAIKSLTDLLPFKDKITMMMDSGIRSGADIGRALAAGADFTFLGRTFMYSVAALGNQGGQHAMAILKSQLKQVMEQVCCQQVSGLTNRKV
ncbi:alpha-hydroxy acid oxidase [Pedobacter nanyangensis]|jgi:L-lactate dehydrogenase (cytochrome)|uniref:alpha-hydroxy acid oxidase n=1 Tax=Pedobacter nanyangensis TaxID=1562389 RepID=UPI000DE1E994|nr:alpha-hydroxy acid oxidase [Pedobacter nanyangensis]